MKLNDSYRAYCLAQRNGSRKKACELECEHEQIKKIYDDWGDIHAKHVVFDRWYTSHKYLFEEIDEDEVFDVTDIGAVDFENNTIIAVPNNLYYWSATQQIQFLLNRLSCINKHGRPSPKYFINGYKKLQPTQIAALKKGINIYKLSESKGKDKGIATDQDIVREIILSKDCLWNWKRNSIEIKLLRKRRYAELNLESEKRAVKRFRASAKSIVQRTLIGRFPIYK